MCTCHFTSYYSFYSQDVPRELHDMAARFRSMKEREEREGPRRGRGGGRGGRGGGRGGRGRWEGEIFDGGMFALG